MGWLAAAAHVAELGLSGSRVTDTLVLALAKLPNIAGVKEASGNLDQMAQVKTRTRLTLLSGGDALTLPCISVGGEGTRASTSGVVFVPVRPGTL